MPSRNNTPSPTHYRRAENEGIVLQRVDALSRLVNRGDASNKDKPSPMVELKSSSGVSHATVSPEASIQQTAKKGKYRGTQT